MLRQRCLWRIAPSRLALALLAALGAGSSEALPLADSVAEFAGVQGRDNWYYGYYAQPGDSASFTPLPFFDPDGAGGNGWWERAPTQPPWTLLWAEGGHPGFREWAVRRWIAEVTGPVRIEGIVRPNSGGPAQWSGVTARILVDGVEVLELPLVTVPPGGAPPTPYSIEVPVAAGTAVDFALDPGLGETFDSTTFTAQITAVPEPSSALLSAAGLAGLALLGGSSRRRR